MQSLIDVVCTIHALCNTITSCTATVDVDDVTDCDVPQINIDAVEMPIHLCCVHHRLTVITHTVAPDLCCTPDRPYLRLQRSCSYTPCLTTGDRSMRTAAADQSSVCDS